MEVVDLGRKPYREVWELQHSVFDAMVEAKKHGMALPEERLFLVEHEPVVTLGKHAKRGNLLLTPEMFKSRGVECFDIERGGDVTYHGPGQLVAYPILDLERHHLGVKAYVDMLEESVIETIAEYGIKGERVEGASGVWIGKGTPGERKICAVGVKCSRFCTMHGLALNVNTNLDAFSMINPCGFVDKGVTSISRELGREVDFGEAKEIFTKSFMKVLSH